MSYALTRFAPAFALFMLSGSTAHAQRAPRSVSVAHTRVRLGDIVMGLGPAEANVDLGPSPSVNGSRLILHEEIESALHARGLTVRAPDSVRVTRAQRTLHPLELETLAQQAIASSNPRPGLRFTAVHPPSQAVVPAGWTSVYALIPRPPRREGAWHTGVVLVFTEESQETARITLTADAELSAEAAKPDVSHGATVQLTVTHGTIEVTVPATLLTDADVGESVALRVSTSGRTVYALLATTEQAFLHQEPDHAR